jgi:hypothetical protein
LFIIESIEDELNNVKVLNKNLDSLRLNSEKLNKYIYKENETKINLEKQFEITTNEFIENLKDAQQDTIKMQDKLQAIKIEKEKLMKDLIETE